MESPIWYAEMPEDMYLSREHYGKVWTFETRYDRSVDQGPWFVNCSICGSQCNVASTDPGHFTRSARDHKKFCYKKQYYVSFDGIVDPSVAFATKYYEMVVDAYRSREIVALLNDGWFLWQNLKVEETLESKDRGMAAWMQMSYEDYQALLQRESRERGSIS